MEDTAISAADIQDVLNSVEIVKEPKISFPQADTFERVINLCELAQEHSLFHQDITEQYAFDARQTDYYTNAARYLGLLDKHTEEKGTVYSLSTSSTSGKKIFNLNYKQRQLAFCRCILSHRIFNKVLRLYFRCGVMPSKNEVVAIMKEFGVYRVQSDETFERRASTVKSWINWIVSLINE